MKKIIGSNKGMSLVEVAIAMLIVAIGILGLAPMMAITMDANSLSQNMSIANTLAQDKIESLRVVGAFSPLPFVEINSGVYGTYDLITQVDAAESDSTVPSGVFRIHVDVRWIDHSNLPRSLEYWTYISK